MDENIENSDGKKFADIVIKQCNQDQIREIISELSNDILNEWGGNYNKLIKDYFPKKE
jgi:hypothetical protein